MKNIFNLKDMKVKNKRVLLRADLNTPLDKKTGKILDDTRLKATLPTLNYLIKRGAMTIIICHLGRPKGQIVEELRTEKLAKKLSKLLGKKVYYLDDCIGQDVEDFVDKMVPGEVVLLENVRFYEEEKANDADFASSLSDLADIYVNDAFGAAHRAHASVEGVTKYIPSCAGFLLQKEIEVLGNSLENPKRPFVAIMGGLKVSDKIKAIENLLKKVDQLLIVGAMAYTFYKAENHAVGDSFIEQESVPLAKKLLKNKKILLPMDNVIADKFDAKANARIVNFDQIPDNWEGLDIGPDTAKQYSAIIKKANTVIWNGTAGVAEWKKFAKGSEKIANAIAKCKGITIIGGGETAAFIKKVKLENKVSHVSTGGGASLEFLEGKKLPAIIALEKNYKKFS